MAKPKIQKPVKKGKSMKTLFAINFTEKTIVASKTTLKKASVPNSPEYKELMRLMKQNPAFAIAEKGIKKAEGKNSYKGLNAAFIKSYISIQSNATELEKQYAKAAELGKFPLVRKWFLNTFEHFNMDLAKSEIEKATLAKIAAAAQSGKCEIIEMPAAQNQ